MADTCQNPSIQLRLSLIFPLKGTTILMITMFYMKDLNKPCILIPVTSKSVKNVELVGI